MRNTIFLIAFLICGICFSQNPDRFRDGIRTKLVQPDTLSTFDRDALTPKLGTILYHKDTGVSRWEEWDGNDWVHFGGSAIPRDSIIMQDTQSIDDIYNYWKGTKAEYYSIVGSDPTFPDDKMLFITDSIPGSGGGTANEFVMADGSFKDFIDDDTFATATSTNIPSAESVKAYVDNNSASITTGTFTPTLVDSGGGATYSHSGTGDYIKIDDRVFFNVSLSSIASTGTASGDLRIDLSDIPYGVNKESTGSVGRFSGLGTSWIFLTVRVIPISDYVQFNYKTASTDGFGANYPAGTATAGQIYINGFYITND